MTTSRNEVTINTSQQKALINHFIRNLFGNEGLRADVPKFSPEEYRRVLHEFTCHNCSSISDSRDSLPEFLYQHEQEVILSFLKHYALKALSNSECVPIKDHLANHICTSAMFKILSFETPEDPFWQD